MEREPINLGNEEHPENPASQANPENPGVPENPGRSGIPGVGGSMTANGEDTQMKEESQQSHQEEDASDSDQDDDSAEELYQQPPQSNTQPSLDAVSLHAGNHLISNPTTLAQFQSLLTSNPHLLKIKMENEAEMLENRSGLDALQRVFNEAALNNGAMPHFGNINPFGFSHAFLTQQSLHNNHAQLGNFGNVSGSRIVSPVNTRHSDSPMGSSPGSAEVRETNNNNNSNNNNNHREPQNMRMECSNTVQNSGTSHQPGPSQQSGPSHPPGPSPLPGSNPSQQTSWSFEDQFKQLYELSDEPQRKEFLDDLFSFMQARGQPINRLPIMAKSVLDLYELYNLVIQRGGLVEVINKKLWQEIIKGLRLPSSITSAAFTLRTQYRKYLYDYECSKEHLSTPEELQVAIDGNRREGRRSSYSTYTGNGGGENSVVPRAQHITNQLGLTAPQITLPLIATAGHHNMLNGSAGHNPLSHLHMPPQGNSLGQGNSRSRQLSSPPRNQPRSPVLGRTRSPGLLRSRSPIPIRRHSPVRRSGSPEPQALDLVRSPGRSPAIRSPPTLPGGIIHMGRNQQLSAVPSHSSATRTQDEENAHNNYITINCQSTRRNSLGSLSICATFGGIVYEGVLLPRDDNEPSSQRATPENTQ
ncbi:AT-rich interactive domain-containing protein 3C-like [Odontomachus brunneus]|uniref:AT-rich interactive domain-containing protein 3C-like n=1 Tax=Odontomachus brunneus TaxID=486640 RepID=UPI0013F1CDDA|nr:AT-rich interactive domain-containing protein 3C-like [Odontomachus brunneus]